MKNLKQIILTLVLASSSVSMAQTWETIGTAAFTTGDTQYGCMDVYNGTPYIAYKDVANGSKCTVMRYNGSNWVYVGSQAFTPGISREQSIAIDQLNGDVYVEYTDATINAIVVSKFNDNNGVWEPLGPNGIASSPSEFYQQIKIDNGDPYLVFGGYQATLKQYNPGTPTGTWTATPGPVISFAQAWYTRLAIDGTDKYVIYSDISEQGKASVVLATANSINAVGGVLGFTTGGIGYCDIAVDNGIPYISFQDSINGRRISVMKFNGTDWEYVGGAGISSGNVEHNRILFHNSIPYISYYDNGDGKLHLKKFNGTAWISVGPAVENGSVYLNDMAINDDHVFIAFKEGNSGGKMTVKKLDLNTVAGVATSVNNKLLVYPNPAQNELFIKIDNAKVNQIDIVDLSGKVIQIKNEFTSKLNISDLNKGIYFIKVYTENGISTQRFIKQ
ncbi:hypothetical protein DNU06_00815 [Putridiphycobacter roseus]|uniref:Secretion system C-terminal sorting domain-containing protein n=1 Tax=Putridiphycobacter roseus TaxID=2219161 RepID=A0A2W1N1B8_9FLAO|nr:T9SS type A sorting domain-containing protein [Putridiphycobacter roseus]PZE18409.1 hypothetical protein DNU06_00815 [Putridiphycobacter roseus]